MMTMQNYVICCSFARCDEKLLVLHSFNSPPDIVKQPIKIMMLVMMMRMRMRMMTNVDDVDDSDSDDDNDDDDAVQLSS